MPNATNIWVRKAFDRLKQEFGDRCMTCESEENLEFAHVFPTDLTGRSRGRKERYYDIKNNKECYVLLCRDCHIERDRRIRENA